MVWWLGLLRLGAWEENWHRNHHYDTGSARLDLGWWQTDTEERYLHTLEAIGLESPRIIR